MNTRKLVSIASALVFLGGLMPAINASAQHSSRGTSAGRPSVRAPQSGMSRTPGNFGRSPLSSRGSGRSTPSLGRGAGIGNGAILNELGRRWSDRNDGYHRDRAAEEYADAYRDAALANAAVGLVGILVDAAIQAERPQTVVCPPPSGHYETRRVLVREGYYETRQVWVPEQIDPRTGEIIDGHHETRRTWIPPVYEETQVFVPAPHVKVVQPVAVMSPPQPTPVPVRVVAPLPPPAPMGVYVRH